MFGHKKEAATVAGVATFCGKSSHSNDAITLTSYDITKQGEEGVFGLAGVKAEVNSIGSGMQAIHHLIITGPDFGWSGRVGQTRLSKAIEFSVQVNLAARKAE
jgi:hypothetical protein